MTGRRMKTATGLFCAALLALGAAFSSAAGTEAQENKETADRRESGAQLLEPVLFTGTVKEIDGSRFTLNRELDGQTQEVIVNITEHTKILEAVNGYPVGQDSLAPGSYVHVYVGPAMTMSLPPMTNATLILTQLPENPAAPPAFEKAETLIKNQDGTHTVSTVSGNSYTVDGNTVLLPYLTRNMVYPENLQAGTAFLVWPSERTQGAAAKIVIFQGENGGYQGGESAENGQDGAETVQKHGWSQAEDGVWFYYERGEMHKGWLLDNGAWYYLNPETGAMHTGFLTVDGKTYYLLEDGRMMTEARTFAPDESGALELR